MYLPSFKQNSVYDCCSTIVQWSIEELVVFEFVASQFVAGPFSRYVYEDVPASTEYEKE